MATKWTANQMSAIHADGGSLVVSAAAGSGKTAVLIERVIRLLTDEQSGVFADRLLVVTYTRAAAAELKERLRVRLMELIRENPRDRFLLEQQSRLAKATIATIDSFCSSVVKEFFYELDVDRGFRIGEESELILLRADAMRLTLDALYAEGNEDFHMLVELFSTARDDEELGRVILHIYDFLRSFPFPARWMADKIDCFDRFRDLRHSVWGELIFDYTRAAARQLERLLNSSIAAIDLDEKLSKKLRPLFESDAAMVEKLCDALEHDSWDGVRESLSLLDTKTQFRAPNGYKDNPLKLRAQSNRILFKDQVQKLTELFSSSELESLYDIEILRGASVQLFRAVEMFEQNYAAMKRERRLADYPDLGHWMLSLLVDENGATTAIGRTMQDRFDVVMVDEYQDANELQDTIFRVLSESKDNLFVVGDVKQSIYGFRQAMPEIFVKRKNNAVLYSKDSPSFPAKIILEKNFRSDEKILSAVNFFFRRLMSESVGGIVYDESEMLYPGADYAPTDAPAVELDIIDKNAFGMSAVEAEAHAIAARIKRMVYEERYMVKVKDGDRTYYRPAVFSDFAVLMRSLKTNAPRYMAVFREEGVLAHSEKTESFLETNEIMLISDFLRIINNPALDIELLAVMMSPVFGFSEDDLSRIRIADRHSSLYAAVIRDAAQNEKSRHFLAELEFYRALSVTVSVTRLINTVYDRSSMLSILSAAAPSDTVRDNLRLFLEMARAYEHNTHRGLSGFVSYLDRIVENRAKLSSAAPSDAAMNSVAVMSIHSSKGLEFPICIIAGCATRYRADEDDDVLLSTRYGMALKRKDTVLGAVYNTMPRRALALEIRRFRLSEELRVLYVAMTRAKQKLVMVSTPTSIQTYLSTLAATLGESDTIDPFAVLSANSISDLVIMAALYHPDCEPLREIAGAQMTPDTDVDFHMAVRIIDDAGAEEPADEIPPEDIRATANERVIAELCAHRDRRYPFEGLEGIPAKVAASELSHRFSPRAFSRILSRPAFMQDETMTAADKGTALHAFMQYADFAQARRDIAAEIDRVVSEGYLTPEQGESIDLSRAERFVHSSLVDRVLKGDRVYKEYRFTVKIPASRVDPALSGALADEPVVLQGAVDLCFVEDGELVIVDYKTDRVRHAEKLCEMYAAQLELYRDAMEEIMGIRVRACVIYSIHLGKEIII